MWLTMLPSQRSEAKRYVKRAAAQRLQGNIVGVRVAFGPDWLSPTMLPSQRSEAKRYVKRAAAQLRGNSMRLLPGGPEAAGQSCSSIATLLNGSGPRPHGSDAVLAAKTRRAVHGAAEKHGSRLRLAAVLRLPAGLAGETVQRFPRLAVIHVQRARSAASARRQRTKRVVFLGYREQRARWIAANICRYPRATGNVRPA